MLRQGLLAELRLQKAEVTPLFVDNTATIAMAEPSVIEPNTPRFEYSS
jgi:hypothetical protein